jgi:hypothetical protein
MELEATPLETSGLDPKKIVISGDDGRCFVERIEANDGPNPKMVELMASHADIENS